MSALDTAILVTWVAFWIYWLIAAFSAKPGSRRTARARIPGALTVGLVIVLTRLLRGNRSVAVHTPAVQAIGVVLLVCGLVIAVWARIYLGHNWGMPMTRKDEPELVTSGPYARIRHPIYSGILLGFLGTALATDLYWLIAFFGMGVYFVWSAVVEERLMAAAFPRTYPGYRARTKLLIPFVL